MNTTLTKFSRRPILSFFPFIETSKHYTLEKLKKDLVAGLTVAIVALPQSMAYAIIAGVDPKYGLYAAMIPTIIAALFGSSRYLIAGPTNAISMVVASTMTSAAIAGTVIADLPESEKIAMLFLLAFLVGAIQLIMGFARFGGLINFVSHSVIVGFSAGAGVLIFFNQLKNFLGLSIPSSPEFIETFENTILHIGATNMFALGLGIFTVIFIILAKKISPRIPGPLLSLIISAGIVWLFDLGGYGVKLIGEIPRSFPPFSSFPFDLHHVRILFAPALAIAILGIVEALSIAKSIASRTGDKIDGNQEFIGQGLSNIASSFFSSIPGSGSFTRSAVNFKAGAITRFAGVISGLLVLLIVLIFAPFARFIPNASLAGILMVIAYGMIDRKQIILSWKATNADRMVVVTTLLATIFLDLELAVYIGIILSLMLFLRKISHPSLYEVLPREKDHKMVPRTNGEPDCPQVRVYQIEGSLFFGAISDLEDQLYALDTKKPHAIIIRMKSVSIIDGTGIHALERFMHDCKKKNTKVILTGVNDGPLRVFKRTGVIHEIGETNIVPDTTVAIRHAFKKYINKKQCETCPHNVFTECHQ